MLNGANLRNIYSKIQTHLFYMIPEKWDRIYLYVAVVEDKTNKEKGEMFFYYYPSGILKKNPINVYEIPSRFNIEENTYLKLVDELYEDIKILRKEFKRANEKLWTSFTISIEDLKFKIEYDYDDILSMSDEQRHIIWQYKYLDLDLNRLPKKQRKFIEEYLQKMENEKPEIKRHTENMYNKKIRNNIDYDKSDIIEEDMDDLESKNQKKKDKYELYKEQQKRKQKQLEEREQKEEKKNQILNL